MTINKWKILSLFSMILLFSSCGGQKGSKTLTIASKNFTENIVLAHIVSELVSGNSDIEVITKPNLGATFLVWEAMQNGDIDIYPDYTGTIYQAHLKKTEKVSAEESLRIAQQEMNDKYQMKVFDPFGLNNTYAIGMLRTRAEELGISKISDLRNHLDLVAGFDSEFISRDTDGSGPMFAAYGFEPEQPIVQLEIGLRYKAIIENQADYTDAFSTDAKLKRFDMVLLEDDLSFFPPYYAVTVARQDALERFPELPGILAKLVGTIDDETMTAMNYDVEEKKIKPKEVAIKFLKSRSLIK
ncbi:glycine betaine ABC transporter substrate-binding protein [Candidatus Haliotispira prima]|uniref:Glycine betaine ABC transporter substrate-binding protein n=1 Tax=Candidatus Haliotispira prima TaxID=3034016 RepID=A0ABY8MM82_9SPIO|nr:glycine betaine ABC transporter substrate-binding protein [Candidatus Haliotispira prima]